MGNNEEVKTPKSEKPSSPTLPDQTNVHAYPDWAAMQAYYGSRMAMPPYYNAPMAASGAGGHAPPPPYMWGPQFANFQPMMPPYGAPYAAIYPGGGIYAHPAAVPLAATPLSVEKAETPSKLGNADQSLIKKLKSFDGLAMSIGNGATTNTESGAEHKLSQSEETETSMDGTGTGSGGNTTETDHTRRKRGRDGKTKAGSTNVTASAKLELRGPAMANVKSSPTDSPVLSPEVWTQNEKEAKRERRKQSNRESARRSRLRKQAETEELARQVEAMNAENRLLKSEINDLNEKSYKLKHENTLLVEKLKYMQSVRTQDAVKNVDNHNASAQPDNTENLLSRVSNPVSNVEDEEKAYEKNTNSSAKLHQLLDASPRADPVAAS